MTEETKKTLKDSTLMRWVILFMVSALMFATYWFQDFYSGLKPLMESQLGITSSQFATMISFTTIANLLGMIIIGGIILDRWGIKLTTVVFGSVAALGGIISALGANDVISSDPGTRLVILTVGRLVFGIGLEITCVLITRTIVKWFKGYELALAMAINMGIGRLGSAIGTAISPEIGNGYVPAAVTLAATLIGVGFILMLIYLIFDMRIDKQLAARNKEAGIVDEEEPFRFDDLKKLFTNKSFLLIAGLCVAFYSAVFPFMQYAPDLLINEYGFSYKLEHNSNEELRQKISEGAEDSQLYQNVIDKRQERVALQKKASKLFGELKEQLYSVNGSEGEMLEVDPVTLVKKLNPDQLVELQGMITQVKVNQDNYRRINDELNALEEKLTGGSTMTNVMIFLLLFVFGLLFPLLPSNIKSKKGKVLSLGVLSVLFIYFIYSYLDVFALWVKNGPKAAAFLPMGTILFTPIFGRMVDKKGKAASVMLIGAALLIFSHFTFAFIDSTALCYVSLFSLGIAFSLVPAAMWPSVAKIVPERRLGSAYAGMFTIQNYGLFIFFKGIGTVLDKVNPKVVESTQTIRSVMKSVGVPNGQISDNIQYLRNVGQIQPYNYTIPVTLFIACGVIAIFLALQLKKTSKEMGYGLEEPTNS
ncbi:MAG TPA: MFS transporter [Candidatus Krumholzibacteriaceae bacterium]|nr:MFS transporter [Candidatus Krumholzibacteriaceae bacterium]